MTDLLPQIPQDVENGLNHALTPCGLLVRQQEQKIDVRAGRQCATPIAANSSDGEPLTCRAIFCGVKKLRHEMMDGADDLIFQMRNCLRAGHAIAASFECRTRFGASIIQRFAKHIDRCLAKIERCAFVRTRNVRQLLIELGAINDVFELGGCAIASAAARRLFAGTHGHGLNLCLNRVPNISGNVRTTQTLDRAQARG